MQIETAKQCLEIARNQFNESIDDAIRARRAWEASTAKNRAEAVAKVKETRKQMKLASAVFQAVRGYVKAEFGMDDNGNVPKVLFRPILLDVDPNAQ